MSVSAPPASVVTIGTFDGIHRGHKTVLEEALAIAHTTQLRPVILTFEPYPRDVLRPQNRVFRLTTAEVKRQLISLIGNFDIHTLNFTREFSQQSPESFVQDILLKQLNAKHVIVGHDFHFGKDRLGTPQFLVEQGYKYAFETSIVGPFTDENGAVISSSRIRECLRAGDIPQANGLLGHAWYVSGVVQHGAKRGRELDYPTANLHLSTSCELRHGIYAVRVFVDGMRHIGAASYGVRPQFDNGLPILEVHIVTFDGDLYGKTIQVEFLSFLRDEAKFDSIAALKEQMGRDVVEACSVASGFGLRVMLNQVEDMC